jgi:hypothetical protein
MSQRHPPLSYHKIMCQLCEANWDVGNKLVQRVRWQEGCKCLPPWTALFPL